MENEIEKREIINLTPHDLVIFDENGCEIFRETPSGVVARVTEEDNHVGWIRPINSGALSNGLPVELIHRGFKYTIDLPPPKENVTYFVSLLVLQDNPHRLDLAAPGTLVRDEKGNILGITNFIVNWPHVIWEDTMSERLKKRNREEINNLRKVSRGETG